MVIEVRLGVLRPEGMVEVERHPNELPRERRDQVDALAQQGFEVGERQPAAGRGRRVADRNAAHVTVGAVVLNGKELHVEAGELPHRLDRNLPHELLQARQGDRHRAGLVGKTARVARNHRRFPVYL